MKELEVGEVSDLRRGVCELVVVKMKELKAREVSDLR
eukprot:CAMPEP_0174252996 /NCGR_PEP_ID=MMETSP0439-20130205/2387_1 /TAXON_ID=0 /ORGANISM="Stereomyxa ramosa, Strain Chinc5" /LENGTH=36 /DNA_ID= /DNA_START= /DNA_END= /DNA_ORIENTATION=